MSRTNEDQFSVSVSGQNLAFVASPIVLFYTGGCLLSLGYFQRMGPALFTAFSATELALAGFARITTVAAGLAVFAALMTLLASAVARIMPAWSTNAISDRVLGILCIVDALLIVSGLFSMGIYSSLLGILTTILIMAIGLILIMQWQERFRTGARRFVYLSAPLVLMLGLLAIGEGSFLVAIDPKTAQPVTVPFGGTARDATLLALGADAMIYQLDNCLYLSSPRGEGPLKVGCERTPTAG